MEKKTMTRQKEKVTEGSGNVFADLGFPDAAQALAKAEIASRISDIIEERELTQSQAAEILGIDQPRVSDLVRGRLGQFTLDRLFRFLNALDRDIEIVIKPVRTGSNQPRIRVAPKRTKRRAPVGA